MRECTAPLSTWCEFLVDDNPFDYEEYACDKSYDMIQSQSPFCLCELNHINRTNEKAIFPGVLPLPCLFVKKMQMHVR